MYNVKLTEEISAGRFTINLDCIEKNNNIYPYSYIKFKPGVCVIPILNDKIALTKEYRYTFKKELYQFTCGMINNENTPEETVIKEIQEELGLAITKIQYLGYDLPSVGSTDEKIYLYAATCKIDKQINSNKESLEIISYELKTINEINDMINQNKIVTGASVIAWYKWLTKNKIKL